MGAACCPEDSAACCPDNDSDAESVCSHVRDANDVTVLHHYIMKMGDSDIMGEGTSSICRRGLDTRTGNQVAIKVYKSKRTSDASVNLKKFKRQIQVLQELMQPLTRPSDPRLWCTELEQVSSNDIFMQLIDYSRDRTGNAGPDPRDGVMYVITELASYSLKDYFKDHREKKHKLTKATVQILTRQLILVVAGLHAKGLAHLDLKPENLMIFDGSLKLIDVDGCVKIGKTVSIDDSSLSFSPCYCAPEWAAFVCDEGDVVTTVITPALDVWSVGLTIGELVTLDAVLRSTYASFLKHGRSHQDAGFLFLEWLAGRSSITLPNSIQNFDSGLVDLLSKWLLVDKKRRKTLAEALSHPYVRQGALVRSQSSPLGQRHPNGSPLPDSVERVPRRPRSEDHARKVLHQGTLWKLNTNGDIRNKGHWNPRDMWITVEGNLGYLSQKENKRLVLLDGHRLAGAQVKRLSGSPFVNAFELLCKPEHDDHRDEEFEHFRFACADEKGLSEWLAHINRVHQGRSHYQTMKLGNFAKDLRVFRQKNRRIHIDSEHSQGFEPAFKGRLWKVKTEGNRTVEQDWFLREMWLSKNGSLVYVSVKEDNRHLVYYSHQDVQAARITRFRPGEACKPWGFQVQLPKLDGVDFEPGGFAADSEELREKWLKAFAKFGATILA